MALHLTVGQGLQALVDPLARVLSDVPADLFTPEVVAIPGEGVKSWFTWQLSQRLGGTQGIVANVEWVFPATIGRRALGVIDRHDPWGVDALTWAIHTVLRQGALASVPDEAVDLGRARAIADLFDRYGLRRPGMVLAWEHGHDVDALGRPLPEAQRWQPLLWRALVQYAGAPSSVATSMARLRQLRTEGPTGDLPERFVVAGVTGLAWFQLEVLAALAVHREVHVLAPVPSTTLWLRLFDVVERRRTEAHPLEVARSDDPTVQEPRHPLLRSWGRASREAQSNLASVLGGPHALAGSPTDTADTPTTVLGRLQADLRSDLADLAITGTGSDDSVRWHRCHGPARQAEVVRDALLHLFERRRPDGTPLIEPRDVAVLCTDVATFAPLLEAAFAGAPEHGVPEIPVRTADRTLGGETPLFDVAAGVCGLLERRWRRDEVLDMARLPAVRRRFGYSSDDVNSIDQWLCSTGVRWGMTPADHHRAGLPEALRAHTIQSGLDQLFVGAALETGAMRGPGDVAPTGDLEGDDVALLGAFTEFVTTIGLHVEALSQPATVPQWITRLRAAVSDLARLSETDAWQWGALDRELSVFSETARLADAQHDDTEVDPTQLANLVVARLGARPGRARFDTGAVTVSSLAAQRGVPRRVVVVMGLDETFMGSGVAPNDDLVAAGPFVGDPDARAELRALLLDAVLAAQDHLLLVSTGFDVRTNEDVAPAVALAELVDVVDALTGGSPSGRTWMVDHPRQPWNPRALQPGVLGVPGPWTFHRGVAELSARLRQTRVAGAVLDGVLVRETGDRTLGELVRGVVRPVEALLRDRCGMALPGTGEEASTALPLGLESLDAWNLRDRLLGAVLSADPPEASPVVVGEELDAVRRRGLLPPLALGDRVAGDLGLQVDQLLRVATSLGATLHHSGAVIDLDIAVPGSGLRRVTGRIAQVQGDQVLRITPSTYRIDQELSAWVELVALTVAFPERPWHAVVVGRADIAAGAKGRRLSLASVDAAHEALAVIVDLVDRARCDVVPLDAGLSETLHRKGVDALHSAWANKREGRGAHWINWAVGDADLDTLLDLPAWSDTPDDLWGAGGRLERWTHRLWTAFDDTTAPASATATATEEDED